MQTATDSGQAAKVRKLPRVRHRVQVTSFGGSGTTMLLRFLTEAGGEVSKDPDWGVSKHRAAPPVLATHIIPENFRAIYLVSDPVDALVSVFRRGFHMWHALRMQSHDLWPAYIEIKDYPHEPAWGLKDFLDLRRDCFGLERQFDNWTTSPSGQRGYPIMVVKYEALWDEIPRILDFAGIAAGHAAKFPPRKRRKSSAFATPKQKAVLDEIYAGLRQKIAALPGCRII